MTELWTLDELTEMVGTALATDHPGPPNGRVRAFPDQRAIRWYTTIGLVDRPAELRGRSAFYGRRHLLQLVAIKRRQADGLPLARIQAELSGATDDQLQAIAALPENLPTEPAGTPTAQAGTPTSPAPRAVSDDAPRDRFWTERPVAEPLMVTAIRLSEGVTVVLDRGGEPQLEAVRSAAQPLLDELTRQGFLTPDTGDPR